MNVVSPLDAVALSVTGAVPRLTGEAGVKVTVWLAPLMTTLAVAEALA